MDTISVLKVMYAGLMEIQRKLDDRSPNLEEIKVLNKHILQLVDKQLNLKPSGDPEPPK